MYHIRHTMELHIQSMQEQRHILLLDGHKQRVPQQMKLFIQLLVGKLLRIFHQDRLPILLKMD